MVRVLVVTKMLLVHQNLLHQIVWENFIIRIFRFSTLIVIRRVYLHWILRNARWEFIEPVGTHNVLTWSRSFIIWTNGPCHRNWVIVANATWVLITHHVINIASNYETLIRYIWHLPRISYVGASSYDRGSCLLKLSNGSVLLVIYSSLYSEWWRLRVSYTWLHGWVMHWTLSTSKVWGLCGVQVGAQSA